jgi:hypothetical protein
MEKHSFVRTIYLYLFACLGLVLLTIGAVNFLDMGLKVFVFTGAEQEERLQYKQPAMMYFADDAVFAKAIKSCNMTAEQKQQFDYWLNDYKTWKADYAKLDVVNSRRQRDASINLALIIVGLPLYLYHWAVIKRDVKKQVA